MYVPVYLCVHMHKHLHIFIQRNDIYNTMSRNSNIEKIFDIK